MADQYDRDLERDNRARGGQEPAGDAGSEPGHDETEAMEQKLRRTTREDLMGQMEGNVNLSGSTTWETLPDQADAHLQHGRKGQAESPNDLTHEEQPKQHKRGGRG